MGKIIGRIREREQRLQTRETQRQIDEVMQQHTQLLINEAMSRWPMFFPPPILGLNWWMAKPLIGKEGR